MDKLFVLIENRQIPFAIMFAIWMVATVVIRKWYKNRPEREAQNYLDWKAQLKLRELAKTDAETGAVQNVVGVRYD